MSVNSATSDPAQKVASHGTASVGGHEIGYPHGHLGHLSADEENAFRNFKLFLQEKGLYNPGPPASHDDQTLIRFLRARRWVVQDAYKQFSETEEWRTANHLDVLYDTIDIDAYEQTRRLYPQWTGRRDKRGIPLYLFEIRHLDSKTVSTYEKSAANSFTSKAETDGNTPPKLLRLFALYENLTRFAQPLCTNLPDRPHLETPITLSTNIVDVSGVSLRQFWNLKAHMQAASTLATAHYPETLDRIFIIGAPMFFSTVWGWIKRWFDPITVSKIFILGSHEVKSTLESFVDLKNIPKQYGGELEFNWGEMPNLDPIIHETVTWENGHTAFPKGPMYWRPIGDGETLECVAIGTAGPNHEPRLERVCTMPRLFKPLSEETPAPAAGEEAGDKPAVTTGVETADAPATSTNSDATSSTVVDGVQKLSINGASENNEPVDLSEKRAQDDAQAVQTTVA
ncbi:CRAL/TRIO domain-containing protein [Coniochaeta sp. PMI_546]|nr:CRAL/TRIO domain-containing protein [Coniochaeta sp. PMI_546]